MSQPPPLETGFNEGQGGLNNDMSIGSGSICSQLEGMDFDVGQNTNNKKKGRGASTASSGKSNKTRLQSSKRNKRAPRKSSQSTTKSQPEQPGLGRHDKAEASRIEPDINLMKMKLSLWCLDYHLKAAGGLIG